MSTLTQIYKEDYENYLEEIGVKKQRQTLTLTANMYSAITSSFKWNKLPKQIPWFFPERWLFNNGLIGAYVDENGLQMFPAFGNGSLTDYGLFSEYTLIKPNGETFIKKYDEIELCYNNSLMYPSFFLLKEIVDKCNTALNAVDNTLRRASFSKIIECKNPDQKNLVEGILSGTIDMDKIAIVTLSSALKNGEIAVHTLFDNKADDVLSLWDTFARYRNMGYTTFGFDTVEIQKRERLTQAEGSANSEISRYSLFEDMFTCRKDFEQRLKDNLGVDIEIDINRNSNTVYNMQLDNEEKIDNELIEISKGSNLSADYNEDGGEEIDGEKE